VVDDSMALVKEQFVAREGEDKGDAELGYASGGRYAWRVDGVFSEEPDEAEAPDEEWWAQAWEAPLDVETQRALFDEFDEDSSGAIDEGEIWAIVRRLGIQIDGGRAGLRRLMTEIDDDKSGEIEFDEFTALLQRAEGGCSQANLAAALARSATTESPRQVIDQVMRGMRCPDEPYVNHGASTAVRYCSPTNGASSLTPEAFLATYASLGTSCCLSGRRWSSTMTRTSTQRATPPRWTRRSVETPTTPSRSSPSA